jgi:S-disulfanyl-L-cysteine oxidoreductase SoxD
MGAWKMRYSPKLAISVMIFVSIACLAAMAQMPDPYSNVGRSATPQEVQAWDIAISVDGKELPPGSGTAKEGAEVYAKKCAGCHGRNGEGVGIGTPNPVGPVLVGGRGTIATDHQLKTLGSFYPFATTAWDYINRAMPRGNERTLTPTEVYGVTAFLLYKNGIIQETDVMDAKSLPKVQMPFRNNFLPSRLEDLHDLRKRGCRVGQCPETNSK